MNDQNKQNCAGPFLPILLIGLALCVLFIWQLDATSKQGTAFKSTIERQQQLVDQSKQVQGGLERLVNDLLDLAKAGDADAQAVVGKYGIKRQEPAATPEK
jgi:hypothetical protein